MQQIETQKIKYRPDGSIDTSHYVNIGRQRRAQHALTLVKRLAAAILFVSPAKANHEEP